MVPSCFGLEIALMGCGSGWLDIYFRRQGAKKAHPFCEDARPKKPSNLVEVQVHTTSPRKGADIWSCGPVGHAQEDRGT